MLLPELPLLRRELAGLLRTRKAAWCVRMVLFLSCAIPLCFWPSGRGRMFGTQSVGTFCAFFLAQLTAALIVVPAFTAGAIAGERESDTYDALYTTLLRPSSIVLCKVTASAGFILLVLAIASPAAFVLYFLGGLTLATILKCYAVLAAALISSAIVCLHHSMGSKRTAHAAVRGYFWVFFWNVGLMALGGLIVGLVFAVLRTSPTQLALGVLYSIVWLSSPYMVIATELFGSPGGPGFAGMGFGLEPWMIYIAFAGTLSLVHFLLLLRKARTPQPPTQRWLERRAERRRSGARPMRRSFLIRWLTPTPTRAAYLFSNPIFQKELMSEFFGQRRYRRATFWLPLLLFGGIAVMCFQEEHLVLASTAVTWTALTLEMLLVPAVAASSFPRELEQGNLDFLRSTHLTWKEIHRGKFWAAACSGVGIVAAATWIVGGAALLHMVADWGTNDYLRQRYGQGQWVIIVVLHAAVLWITLLATAALATTISAYSRRTLGALIATYGLLVVWLVGAPFLLLVMDGPGLDGEDLLAAIHPHAAVVMSSKTPSGWTLVYLGLAALSSFLLTLTAVGRLERNYAFER